MKHRTILAATLLAMMSLALTSGGCKTDDGASVYICTGKSARVYHSTPECRGLQRCSGDVKEVSVSVAKELHRRPCRLCVKR